MAVGCLQVIIYSAVISLTCCQKLMKTFERLHAYPRDVEFEIPNLHDDVFTNLNRILICRKSNEVIQLEMKLVIVQNMDLRTFGQSSLEILFCYSSQGWKPGGNCSLQTSILVTHPPPVSFNQLLMMQCQYKGLTYTTELFIPDNLVTRLVSYPFISEGRTVLFHPAASVGCLSSNVIFCTWEDQITKKDYRNFYVLREINETGCHSTKNPPLHYIYLQCSLENTTLHNISFVVQYCFLVDFRSHLKEARSLISFDAGEKISCTLKPIFIGKSYFDPSIIPVVTITKDLNDLNVSKVLFEVPENYKGCTNCFLKCGFKFSKFTYFFTKNVKSIKILTDYKTHLEMKSRNIHANEKLQIFFDDEFRCITSYYKMNVKTTIVKMQSAMPPYSQIELMNVDFKISSEPNSWIKMNKTLYERHGHNNWLIYCLISDSAISSPIYFDILPVDKSFIKWEAIYPPPYPNTPIVEGSIFKCKGENVVHLKIKCLSNCRLITIKSFPRQRTSYVIINPTFVRTTVEIKCEGYKTYLDQTPLIENQILDIYPSRLNDLPSAASKGAELFCYRKVKINNTMQIIQFDSTLFLSKSGKSWNISSDIFNNVNGVLIPTETFEESAMFCCVDTIDDNGNFACSNLTKKKIEILNKIETTYFPYLNEYRVSSLEPGTVISCRVCLFYSNDEKIAPCFARNSLELIIDKPGQPIERMASPDKIALPDPDPDTQYEKWNISIYCKYNGLRLAYRGIKLKSCKDLIILPERKEVFLLNDTIECALSSSKCRSSFLFNITIFTENILTLNAMKGIGVVLDSRFVGRSLIICSVYDFVNISTTKTIFLETGPLKVNIVNYKPILIVGDVMTCTGTGFPFPSQEWWYIYGPRPLKIVDNQLMIIPNIESGNYVYDCLVENFHGRLVKRAKFHIYNKYKRLFRDTASINFFYPIILFMFGIFVVLFIFCNFFIFGVHFSKHSKLT